MELSHWGFSSNNTGDIKAQFVNSLFEVNKDNIREDLEPIPTAIDDNLAAVPDLTGMAHAWLR